MIARCDEKRAASHCDLPPENQRFAPVDQSRALRAVSCSLLRNIVVVGLVGLREIRRLRMRHRAFVPHQCERSRGVEATRKCDADLFADGEGRQDFGHREEMLPRRGAPQSVSRRRILPVQVVDGIESLEYAAQQLR